MTIGTEPQIDVAPAAHRLHRKGFEHRSGTRTCLQSDRAPGAGLAELYQPEDQYFPHTMRGCAELTGPQLRPEGDDLRYAAIVALGLASYPP
jgi:hypothetical protein